MDPELVKQFVEVTGENEATARHYLQLADGNLESAITLMFECGTTNEVVADVEPPVRPPILPKQEILVPSEPASSFSRPSNSVFDRFRDFAVETQRQEEEMAHKISGEKRISSEKLKRLEDLFRPPSDILFLGTFMEVREHAKRLNRWLLVNVQNPQEFACQILNRDVWPNSHVKEIVKDHFVLWQVLSDSSEGKRFTDFYSVAKYPYLALVDPRTGECVRTYSNITVDKLISCLNDILSTQASPDSSQQDDFESMVTSQHSSSKDSKKDPELGIAKQVSEQKKSPVRQPIVSSELQSNSDCPKDQPVLRLCLRLPNGSRENLSMCANNTVQDFLKRMETLGYPREDHTFNVSFPRTNVGALPASTPLIDTVLFPSNTVFITKN